MRSTPVRWLLNIPVPWVFVLNYLVGVAVNRAQPIVIPEQAQVAATVAGIVLFAAGAVIAGWALVLFRTAHTTTVPGERSTTFVTSGPYRFTRNPMYVGLTLAYLGEAGILKHIWP